MVTEFGNKWKSGMSIEVLQIAYKLVMKEIRKQLGGEVKVREGTGKLVGV